MSAARVTIVTPTIPARQELLLGRCIPSVAGQDYDGVVDQVVVSDPNPDLAERLRRAGTRARPVTVVELNDTWRNPRTSRCTGSFPWRVGSLLAHGDYVGFCGDDDELHPEHVARHVAAMETSGADFSVSRVAFCVGGDLRMIVGDPGFGHGQLDADGIMCRRACLRVANWDIPSLEEPSSLADAGDYRMVRDWRAAGLRGVFVDGPPTATHHDGWAAR